MKLTLILLRVDLRNRNPQLSKEVMIKYLIFENQSSSRYRIFYHISSYIRI